MQSIAIDPGWAGWVFTSPTQILKNHVWMFSAALLMSRLEKNSIEAHLNQDIKPPFAVLRLPESSSDLCLQMVMWQMILPKDIQDTETHSDPMQETAVWRQLWGPFCVKLKLLPHRHSLEGREGNACDSKGLFPWTALSSSLWQWSTDPSASKTKSTAQIQPRKAFQESRNSPKLKIFNQKAAMSIQTTRAARGYFRNTISAPRQPSEER